ncbi:hypothetical protein QE428_002611 [Microbacterium sp. SORGH_AS 505]|uniref:hypothetical protein n=1 Tax=Microbacterium sp. SORGH_AS_0505 TaxID=3041770 RepID=UPI00277EC3B9|nr:hypothetical protein [Microbacterium sp. SORGH_AS_0505]MDQ1127578.1 hypothetical protein [Microbacterium sp. SORGH_AS_0505]
MNRYAAAGITAEASLGKRILVIAPNAIELREGFLDLIDAASTTEGAVIRRANGAERIDYPNRGGIRFATTRSTQRARGTSFDTIYVEAGADLTPDQVAELSPCFATTGGTFVRA